MLEGHKKHTEEWQEICLKDALKGQTKSAPRFFPRRGTATTRTCTNLNGNTSTDAHTRSDIITLSDTQNTNKQIISHVFNVF